AAWLEADIRPQLPLPGSPGRAPWLARRGAELFGSSRLEAESAASRALGGRSLCIQYFRITGADARVRLGLGRRNRGPHARSCVFMGYQQPSTLLRRVAAQVSTHTGRCRCMVASSVAVAHAGNTGPGTQSLCVRQTERDAAEGSIPRGAGREASLSRTGCAGRDGTRL